MKDKIKKIEKLLNVAKRMRTKAEKGTLIVEEDGIGYEYFDGKVQALSEVLLILRQI